MVLVDFLYKKLGHHGPLFSGKNGPPLWGQVLNSQKSKKVGHHKITVFSNRRQKETLNEALARI
jgi:hypothetical protein